MTPEGKVYNMRPAGDLEPRWYGCSLLRRRLVPCSVDESQVVPAKSALLIQLDFVPGSRLTETGRDGISSNFQMMP